MMWNDGTYYVGEFKCGLIYGIGGYYYGSGEYFTGFVIFFEQYYFSLMRLLRKIN